MISFINKLKVAVIFFCFFNIWHLAKSKSTISLNNEPKAIRKQNECNIWFVYNTKNNSEFRTSVASTLRIPCYAASNCTKSIIECNWYLNTIPIELFYTNYGRYKYQKYSHHEHGADCTLEIKKLEESDKFIHLTCEANLVRDQLNNYEIMEYNRNKNISNISKTKLQHCHSPEIGNTLCKKITSNFKIIVRSIPKNPTVYRLQQRNELTMLLQHYHHEQKEMARQIFESLKNCHGNTSAQTCTPLEQKYCEKINTASNILSRNIFLCVDYTLLARKFNEIYNATVYENRFTWLLTENGSKLNFKYEVKNIANIASLITILDNQANCSKYATVTCLLRNSNGLHITSVNIKGSEQNSTSSYSKYSCNEQFQNSSTQSKIQNNILNTVNIVVKNERDQELKIMCTIASIRKYEIHYQVWCDSSKYFQNECEYDNNENGTHFIKYRQCNYMHQSKYTTQFKKICCSTTIHNSEYKSSANGANMFNYIYVSSSFLSLNKNIIHQNNQMSLMCIAKPITKRNKTLTSKMITFSSFNSKLQWKYTIEKCEKHIVSTTYANVRVNCSSRSYSVLTRNNLHAYTKWKFIPTINFNNFNVLFKITSANTLQTVFNPILIGKNLKEKYITSLYLGSMKNNSNNEFSVEKRVMISTMIKSSKVKSAVQMFKTSANYLFIANLSLFTEGQLSCQMHYYENNNNSKMKLFHTFLANDILAFVYKNSDFSDDVHEIDVDYQSEGKDLIITSFYCVHKLKVLISIANWYFEKKRISELQYFSRHTSVYRKKIECCEYLSCYVSSIYVPKISKRQFGNYTFNLTIFIHKERKLKLVTYLKNYQIKIKKYRNIIKVATSKIIRKLIILFLLFTCLVIFIFYIYTRN